MERAAERPVAALPEYPAAERYRRGWELLGSRSTTIRSSSGGTRSRPSGAADLARHRGRRVTLIGYLTTTKPLCTRRELRLSRIFEPMEMVASLIVTGWLLEGAPGGLAIELDGRDEPAIVEEIGGRMAASRAERLIPDRVGADVG